MFPVLALFDGRHDIGEFVTNPSSSFKGPPLSIFEKVTFFGAVSVVVIVGPSGLFVMTVSPEGSL